jgi:hypothetical protein
VQASVQATSSGIPLNEARNLLAAAEKGWLDGGSRNGARFESRPWLPPAPATRLHHPARAAASRHHWGADSVTASAISRATYAYSLPSFEINPIGTAIHGEYLAKK